MGINLPGTALSRRLLPWEKRNLDCLPIAQEFYAFHVAAQWQLVRDQWFQMQSALHDQLQCALCRLPIVGAIAKKGHTRGPLLKSILHRVAQHTKERDNFAC